MENIPNFDIEISGVKGEIFVSDNHSGKYMCVFVNNGISDFTSIYNAYGFMVWTASSTHTDTEFYPIKLKEETKLTSDTMREMWQQISRQMEYLKKTTG